MARLRNINLLLQRTVILARGRVRRMKFMRSRQLSNPNLEAGFFDSYPRFFSTSVTAATPNRLNQRHRALIERNETANRGSHDLIATT